MGKLTSWKPPEGNDISVLIDAIKPVTSNLFPCNRGSIDYETRDLKTGIHVGKLMAFAAVAQAMINVDTGVDISTKSRDCDESNS